MLLVFLVLLIAPGLAHAAAGTSVQVAAADSAANPGNPAGNPANPAATALPRLLRYDATVDGAHVFVDFSCQDSAAALAEMFCDDHSVQPHARCVLQTQATESNCAGEFWSCVQNSCVQCRTATKGKFASPPDTCRPGWVWDGC